MIVSVTTKKDKIKPVIQLLVKELVSKTKAEVQQKVFVKSNTSYLRFSDAKQLIFKIDKLK